MAKRERLEVINDILKVIRDNRSVRPTKVLHSSNLSPQMFKEYIDELLTKKFIEQREEDDKKFYSLTEKGYEFLQKYKAMTELIANFGL
ncbi:MAG: winged helix-turn-helix domain-containing protein [Candidatus Woesearchaeota archaeon]